MKLRRLIVFCALLGTLVVSSVSVSAEEGSTNSISSAIGSITLNGYVDTSLVWQPDSHNPRGLRAWLRAFFLWFRFHALR
jgi:hypothetical protein